MVLSSHLIDDHVLLLELVLNYLKFLRVSERVLALDHFLKLVAETGALVHVHLHLHLDLRDLGTLDVPFETFDLILLQLILILQLFDLSFEVQSQV